MELHQLIVNTAKAGLELINKGGHMPAGHNGSHQDPETPVRNTSHWIITFLKAHQITGEEKYLNATEQCLSFLTNEKTRPHGYTFHHRNIMGKDACNGLIGQAWTIEALVAAGNQLGKSNLLNLAKSVFLLQPFSRRLGAWQVIDIDGSNKGYDFTLNHQIWFAASGAQIVEAATESNQIECQVVQFLDELDSNLHLYPSGLIYHNIHPYRSLTKIGICGLENVRRRRIPMPALELFRPETKMNQRKKAIGYHSFNLYALAMLKKSFPDHVFWQSDIFDRLLEYGQSTTFRNELDINPYGYSFNCSGIEMGFAIDVFEKNNHQVRDWVSEQFKRTYDTETHLMTKNTMDSATLAARFYEVTRLPNINRITIA